MKLKKSLIILAWAFLPACPAGSVIVFAAAGAGVAAGIIGGIFVSQSIEREFDDHSDVFGLFSVASIDRDAADKSTKYILGKGDDEKFFSLDRFPLLSRKNIKKLRLISYEGGLAVLGIRPTRRGKRHLMDVLQTPRSRQAVAVVYRRKVIGVLESLPDPKKELRIKVRLDKNDLHKIFSLLRRKSFSRRSSAF